MTVDIWSDIRCPFCYIGKRKFEQALERFAEKDQVAINWHSFQLDPNLETQPDTDILSYFTKAKNISREQAQQMFDRAKEMGREVGLELDFENSVIANSFLSHQLLQFAKTKGLGDQVKEELFKAHFTEAKNIDDIAELSRIGEAAGLDRDEVQKALEGGDFEYPVKQDEMQAKNLGVQGVPFFVFNNKYGVSGAQAPETFLEVLQKAKAEEV